MRSFRTSSAPLVAESELGAGGLHACIKDKVPPPQRKEPTAGPMRIGLFGYLGSGNLGNDACMESTIRYLRTAHPDAHIDAMCGDPQQTRAAYGIDGIPIFWYRPQRFHKLRAVTPILKVLGKVLDAVRTVAWVRRHHIIIVPGMGVLETDMPISPFGFPYAVFVLSLCGWALGTKVAFIGVGANVIRQRLIRWFFASAARLASYRSYRDAFSRQAIRAMGVDTRADDVCPDLVFALPLSSRKSCDPAMVAVGVMNFRGSNDDRGHAAQIYARYLDDMTSFVIWLVRNGRTVRLIVGDAKSDSAVVQVILSRVFERLPHLDPNRIVASPIYTTAQLVDALAAAKSVVASRYHNVIFALRLNKPTIAIAYAPKHVALMNSMGLSCYLQELTSLDVDRLIEQFTELEASSDLLARRISQRNAANARHAEAQFRKLSEMLLAPPPARDLAESDCVPMRKWHNEAGMGQEPDNGNREFG